MASGRTYPNFPLLRSAMSLVVRISILVVVILTMTEANLAA
jgi:hypothetical protein